VSAQKVILIAVAAAVVGFAAGFLFADTANRRERERLDSELTRARAAATPIPESARVANGAGGSPALPDLTDEQLRNAVARADADPSNVEVQRTAGQALHLYAVEKGNASILPDAARILKRAHEAEPKNFDVLLRLANALYLLAQNGDPARMQESRAYLEKAAALKPDDADTRASIGLTYFHDKPPDARGAAREYRKALALDPRHEFSLQNLAAALIESGELAEAEKTLAELERVNPRSAELPNLRASLAQRRNAAGGQR
jgi:tetratricopeptide (TPR) repeat protein